MIEIKTQQQRDNVKKMYNFDKENGKCINESSGQFTGSFYHESYECNGKSMTYYFDSGELFAFEALM